VRLQNGTTVLINENHSQPLVSVQVWVKVGSNNENEKTSGLSHFIEHLIFKGSKNYPGDFRVRVDFTVVQGTIQHFAQVPG